MLDDKALMLFEGNLKRIFALKVSRSTFREIQNVILTITNQDKQLAKDLFEMLLTGKIKEGLASIKQRPILEDVIKHFTIPARLSKEVFERGEFINLITSDAVTQKEELAFVNRIRRIDGEEFIFMSDPESTIHIIEHFVGRLQEFEKTADSKELLKKKKLALMKLAENIKGVAS